MLRDIQGLENSLIKQYYSFLYFHKSSHPISIGFKSCKLHNSIEPWMSQDLCTYIAILTLHMMLLISVIISYNCSNIFKCSLINKSFPLEEKKRDMTWETWHVESQWFLPYENQNKSWSIDMWIMIDNGLWHPHNCDSSYTFSKHEISLPVDLSLTNLIIGFFWCEL